MPIIRTRRARLIVCEISLSSIALPWLTAQSAVLSLRSSRAMFATPNRSSCWRRVSGKAERTARSFKQRQAEELPDAVEIPSVVLTDAEFQSLSFLGDVDRAEEPVPQRQAQAVIPVPMPFRFAVMRLVHRRTAH